VDLVTVAQALHWFNFDVFHATVRRVLKPNGGVYVAMVYDLPIVSAAVDALVRHYDQDIVGSYWDINRKWVDQHYETISLGALAEFEIKEVDSFLKDNQFMDLEWNFEDLLGFLDSWSSTQNFIKKNGGKNPARDNAEFVKNLQQAWGQPLENARKFRWPLFFRIAKTFNGEVMATCDLCDKYCPEPIDTIVPFSNRVLQVVDPIFRDFGGRIKFHGQIATVQIFESNPAVRATLSEPGNGRVLVVDAGGSLRCGVVGDLIAKLGHDNGWAGVVVYGAVRDTGILKTIQFGVKALAPNPRKSSKRDFGEKQIPVHFAGVQFIPGKWLYADEDGIVVSSKRLH